MPIHNSSEPSVEDGSEIDADPAWAEVFLSLFNLSAQYFPALLFFWLRPLKSAQRLRSRSMMSGPRFFTTGLGCLFVCWTVSAMIRQSNTAATLLNVFSAALLLASTYVFASMAYALGIPSNRYRVSRDVYLYAMGSFMVWALILVEIAGLVSTSEVIGSPTPLCTVRGMDCLVQNYGDLRAYQIAVMSIQLLLGLFGIPYTIIVFSVAQRAMWWKGAVCMTAAAAVNIVLSDVIAYAIDYLKSVNVWS